MNSSVIIISVVFILVYCISVVVQDRNERRRKAIESTFWWQYETYLANPDKLIKCEEMKRVFGILDAMFNPRNTNIYKTKEFIFGKTLAVGIPPDFYKGTLNIPLPRNKDDVYRMWKLIWQTLGITLPLKNFSCEVEFGPFSGKITMCLINFDEQEIEEGVFINRVSTSDVTRIIGDMDMKYCDLLDALTQDCESTSDDNMNTENFALSADSRKIIETAKKRLNNQGVNK